MTNPKFPHIIRKISAWFLFFTLTGLITLNLIHSQIFGFNWEKMIKLEIMKKPLSIALHEKLGEIYLSINKNEAEKEYLLAQSLYDDMEKPEEAKVLGTSNSPLETWNHFFEINNTLEKEISYWKDLTRLLPDYQYAYLKLAKLNLELGRDEEAVKYLNTLKKNHSFSKETKLLEEKLQAN